MLLLKREISKTAMSVHAYLNDLNNLNCEEVSLHNDPNDMWTEWLNFLCL
jgi:hypothetical protein